MVPAWQGALHENNRVKIEKNLMTRFCTGRGAKSVKIFSTLFNIFSEEQKTSKIVKKCHQKHFSTVFGDFSRGTKYGNIPAPSVASEQRNKHNQMCALSLGMTAARPTQTGLFLELTEKITPLPDILIIFAGADRAVQVVFWTLSAPYPLGSGSVASNWRPASFGVM